MDYFYLKYIKYKYKYLELSQQIGGMKNKILKRNNFIQTENCYVKGYAQYITECWSDSIQTIVTFAQPFGNTQKYSLNQNNLSPEQIIKRGYENRSIFIPIHIIDENK
jgi:hypothetical protein